MPTLTGVAASLDLTDIVAAEAMLDDWYTHDSSELRANAPHFSVPLLTHCKVV